MWWRRLLSCGLGGRGGASSTKAADRDGVRGDRPDGGKDTDGVSIEGEGQSSTDCARSSVSTTKKETVCGPPPATLWRFPSSGSLSGLSAGSGSRANSRNDGELIEWTPPPDSVVAMLGAGVPLPDSYFEQEHCFYANGRRDAPTYRITREHVAAGLNPLRVDDTHFALEHVIGCGSMAQVVLATHIPTGTVVGLRCFSRRRTSSMWRAYEVLKEVEILKALDSPFTLPVHFSWVCNSNIVMVLPLVTGSDMWHFLWRADKMHLDTEKSRFYCAEIVCALEAVHAFGWAHLDVKLENVLLGDDGHIKLCDFTFAQAFGKRLRGPMGTAGFEAPELHLGQPISGRTDVFSLGVTLFVGVTHALPYGSSIDYKAMPSLDSVMENPRLCWIKDEPLYDDFIDLLRAMLDPSLNRASLADVQAHPFFRGITWENARARLLVPPLKATPASLVQSSASYKRIPMRVSPRLSNLPFSPLIPDKLFAVFSRVNSSNIYLTPESETCFLRMRPSIVAAVRAAREREASVSSRRPSVSRSTVSNSQMATIGMLRAEPQNQAEEDGTVGGVGSVARPLPDNMMRITQSLPMDMTSGQDKLQAPAPEAASAGGDRGGDAVSVSDISCTVSSEP